MSLAATQRRVGVAHPGTQHSWETALAFQEAGRLTWYATSSYYDPDRWPDRMVRSLPDGLRWRIEPELKRRHHPRLDGRLVRRHTSAELLERLLRRNGARGFAQRLEDQRHETFAAKLIRQLEREPVDVLWGPVECADAFDWARPRGVLCVLDQAIGHLASLDGTMREEYRRHPNFFRNAYVGVPEAKLDLQRRAAASANLIVVGSDFAARTMTENGASPEKLQVVPYGFNDGHFTNEPPRRPPLEGRPVEFLFVGSVGARKGVANLLEAFEKIDPSEARLTLAGPLDMPAETLARYDRIVHVGQLRRDEVAGFMRDADCFIFPSLFEGGGIVLYEAAAAGLGIIQTDRCGDGVRDGRNGTVLPDLELDTLVETLRSLIFDKQRLQDWCGQSWSMRHERGWSVYRRRICELV